MTTCYEIIYDAFREGDLIDETEYPTPTQAREGLARLNSILTSVRGYEVGEQLLDWPVGTANVEYAEVNVAGPVNDVRPPANSRLLILTEEATDVYLPPLPRDGARMGILDVYSSLATYPITLKGNGRLIESASTLTLNTAGLSREWMYRADQGNWVRITAITDASTEMPYPDEFDDYFITSLAMRLNPRHSMATDPQTLLRMERMKGKIRARYRQTASAGLELSLIHPNSALFGSWTF